jgi:hypothetical protein
MGVGTWKNNIYFQHDNMCPFKHDAIIKELLRFKEVRGTFLNNSLGSLMGMLFRRMFQMNLGN